MNKIVVRILFVLNLVMAAWAVGWTVHTLVDSIQEPTATAAPTPTPTLTPTSTATATLRPTSTPAPTRTPSLRLRETTDEKPG